MAKRMNDDDIMEHVYRQLFGDLDGIESHSLFDKDGENAVEGTASNAGPDMKGSGGMKITIEPLMASAAEGSKMSSGDDEDEEDDDDKYKGLGGMSPLMAQLHGKR